MVSIFKRKTKKRKYQDGPGHSHDGGLTWHDHEGMYGGLLSHWHNKNGEIIFPEPTVDPFKKK